MAKAILFVPSEEAIDRSVDARKYVNRLGKRVELERRSYNLPDGGPAISGDVASVAVLAGLSSLDMDSGYVEMEMDTLFKPQELLATLRAAVPEGVPVVAVVDDAYSDYILSAYLRAGASAVVGTSGDLFGVAISRIKDWSQLYPYINVFNLA